MPEHSAGILLFRRNGDELEVLLVHPGGPFWASKDEGAWSIPKGLYEPGSEEPLDAARREFEEETGQTVDGYFWDLGEIRQPSRKRVRVFATEGDLDPAKLVSNAFEMEWPPRSGKVSLFPEIDRAGWFDLGEARAKILEGQAGFLDRLEEAVE
jgi:predicted NUDIX family NTP pyrophosphohydrolase